MGSESLGRHQTRVSEDHSDGREVRRILDPDHPSKLPVLSSALRAMGKRLVLSIDEAA